METNSTNSENYLKSVLKNKTGFTTPENYFSDAENRFSSFLSEEKLPDNGAFITPDSYFDNLEDLILSKTTSTEKEVKVISLKQKVLKFIPIAAAACIALFIGLNSFIFSNSENISFDDLADIEIENWIENNTSLISNDDLAFAYTNIDFDESDMVPNSITKDEIENYLSNEDNISLILEND
ncbi:hypothetical protein H9W90_06005 [Polaribacter pectinis]|uniref:Uncharacterized protein n=1 Tax=Polaribacter pectinis TaxID=2738844 RepID=A0A7G9LDH2_9FLAO|nr:hypothetical protein [Polaribacter pectinis]QNM86671.1 hypothetical protein H9W90_06005 [Polaribacter pectinis]